MTSPNRRAGAASRGAPEWSDGDEFTEAQTFVQLTNQNQAAVGGDSRTLEIDLQRGVEGKLKWMATNGAATRPVETHSGEDWKPSDPSAAELARLMRRRPVG